MAVKKIYFGWYSKNKAGHFKTNKGDLPNYCLIGINYNAD